MKKSIALIAVPLVAAGIAVPFVGASAATHTPKLTGGVEHLYIGNTSPNGGIQTLIVTGAVTDYGHTNNTNSNSSTGYGAFTKGRWLVNTAQFKQKVLSQSTSNCWFRGETYGPLVITGGTGAYKGITGTLQFTETFTGIGTRNANGTCNMSNNAPDLATLESGSAVGTIKF
jgi:hypothetical protein